MADEHRIAHVVELLQVVLDAQPNDEDTANNVLFTYSDDWTLVFARGDRAEQTREGVSKLYKVKLG